MTIPIGQIIYAAVKPIFKIYFIIALGFYLARKNILTVTTCRDISDAVVTAIMPCLIFNNIVTYLKSSDIKNLGIIAFEGTLLFIIGGGMALLVSYTTNCPQRWRGGLISVGLFPNISDLPIAYLQTLSKGGAVFTAAEGNKGVAYVCIFLAAQIFFQFSLGLYKLIEWDFRDELNVNDDEEKSIKAIDTDSSSQPKTSHDIENSQQINESNNNDNTIESKPNVESTNHSSDTSISSENFDDDNNLTNNNSNSQPPKPFENNSTSNINNSSHDLTSNNLKKNNSNNKELNQHDEFLRKHEFSKLNSNPRSSISSNSNNFDQPLYSMNSNYTRNRRSSNAMSIGTNYYSLNPTTSRAVDLRNQKSQDINDVINEYSEFNRLKNQEVKRSVTGTSEIGVEKITSNDSNDNNQINDDFPNNDLTSTKISSNQSIPKKQRSKFMTKLLGILKNFTAPNSVSLIISIIIAMSPPLKALFVDTSSVHLHPAPDKQPPLSFVIDLVSYVGNASVPLGLLLLGATISRLRIKSMPPGFWKTAIAITATRLILIPIIGVGLTTGIYKGGWYGDDKLVRFVSVLEYGLPSATSLIYFTAFYTDPNLDEHLQMDCLAICCIAQYLTLWFSLPFLVTFTLKVSIGY